MDCGFWFWIKKKVGVGKGIQITPRNKTGKHSDTCFITKEMLVLLNLSDGSQENPIKTFANKSVP